MTKQVSVDIKRVRDNDLPIPEYETDGAVGFDLRADLTNFNGNEICIDNPPKFRESIVDLSCEDKVPIIPTGFAYKVPDGYEIQIRPRSSMGRKKVLLPNSPGTIDQDYRGEIGMMLYPDRGDNIKIQHGDRIAQAVLSPVVRAEFNEVDELDDTERGDGGFGSTGVE